MAFWDSLLAPACLALTVPQRRRRFREKAAPRDVILPSAVKLRWPVCGHGVFRISLESRSASSRNRVQLRLDSPPCPSWSVFGSPPRNAERASAQRVPSELCLDRAQSAPPGSGTKRNGGQYRRKVCRAGGVTQLKLATRGTRTPVLDCFGKARAVRVRGFAFLPPTSPAWGVFPSPVRSARVTGAPWPLLHAPATTGLRNVLSFGGGMMASSFALSACVASPLNTSDVGRSLPVDPDDVAQLARGHTVLKYGVARRLHACTARILRLLAQKPLAPHGNFCGKSLSAGL
jgi:hypothetical protein